MGVPTGPNHDLTVRLSATGQPPVHAGPLPERVTSVLFKAGIEEWQRGWRGSAASPRATETIVSASDITRGATATTQRVPGQGVMYTIVDASATLESVTEVVSTHTDDGDIPTVLLDDITPVVTERGLAAARTFLAALQNLSTVESVIVGCSYRPDVATAICSLFDPVDDIGHVNHSVEAAIDRLRQYDPTTFGYVRRYWTEARKGIEHCTRNYPQSRQIHATLSDPETTPRTLGATLSGLVEFDVLDTWGDTVGPTRYDLTAYDPNQMWIVGAVLAASFSGPNPDSESAIDGNG